MVRSILHSRRSSLLPFLITIGPIVIKVMMEILRCSQWRTMTEVKIIEIKGTGDRMTEIKAMGTI